jgi:sporulation protein YlmC with PRC-barrel domain
MKRLERLSRLNGYAVERHQTDPRGWEIVNSDHRRIGKVEDLIVDTSTMRAVYLDVELDAKQFDLHDDPRIVIPVERADRHGDHKHLMVSGMDAARVQELCAAREKHYYEFWDSWWRRSGTATGSFQAPPISQQSTRQQALSQPPVSQQPISHQPISEQLTGDDLRRALEQVQPGERVRIPIVNEEIVIERRPLQRDATADAHAERPVVTQHE